MGIPEHFEIKGSYGSYRPRGEVSFTQVVKMVGEGIAYARHSQIKLLLIDSTNLSGFKSPGTLDRFLMSEYFAEEARSKVVVSMIAKEEMIDPDKFGVMVAINRGLNANVFASEVEALEWLLKQDTSSV